MDDNTNGLGNLHLSGRDHPDFLVIDTCRGCTSVQGAVLPCTSELN
jgi:hypothetical protein